MSETNELSYEQLYARLKEMDALVASICKEEVDAIVGVKSVVLLDSARRFEEDLRASREQFRLIYDASPMAIVLYDPDGKMIHVNKSCLSLFGVEDFSDILDFDILSHKRLAREIYEDILAGKPVNYQSQIDFADAASHGLVNCCKKGVLIIDVFMSPMLQPGGKAVCGYLAKVLDITAHRRTQEHAAFQAQLLENVDEAALDNTSFSDRGGPHQDWHNNNDSNNNTTVPSTVNVVVVGYTPTWRCSLYKNDSSRTDGFEGTGATIEEARRNASTRCRSTNNPNCDLYSNSPDHTTCDAQYQETTKTVQYDSNNMPPGATMDSWNCVLNKNDGLSAGSDGFQGFGRTEAAARADAATKCSATNNPRCNNYSTDASHTNCAQQMVMYGPKPSAVWNCSLRKNDGSRNDGFAGTGSTEADARRNAISGCQGTNNPNCSQYSKDPAHTQCTVAFVYPQ